LTEKLPVKRKSPLLLGIKKKTKISARHVKACFF
jgi:hypothetical protein